MKLALLGTGKIVREALLALEHVPRITKVCIYARPHSESKARELSEKYQIPEVYTDYDLLLQNADIDYVYVGLVNSAHYSYAKKALEAGKNVIMEKPFTSTLAEAEEICALAQQKGLYVIEAVTSLHCAVTDRIRELIPKIAPVRLVQSNYSQYSSRYDRYLKGEVEPCFDPALSGGSLYDIDIYNLNLTADLFGEPEEVYYYANKGFNGIDISGVMVMRYPGFVATAAGAKDSDSPCFFQIQGEKGWIRMPEKPSDIRSVEYCVDGQTGRFCPEELPHRMVEEFRDFARIAEEKDTDRVVQGLKTSAAVLRMAEEGRKGAGIHFGVDDETEEEA